MALTKVQSGVIDGGLNLSASAPADTLVTTSAGNVGIGVTSPQTRLQISSAVDDANIQDYITLSRSGYPTSNFRQVISASCGSIASQNNIVFKTSDGTNAPAERVRLDGSGNLMVNTTSRANSATFTVLSGGNISEFRTSVGSCDAAAFYTSGSTLAGRININGSSASYITSSDYRLKENIAPMTGALSKVALLKPCTYTWKESGEASQGFIAHELQAVCPDAVVGEKDAVNENGSINPQGIDTSYLVATLTAAIQEQQAIITDLKARIETLEAK